LKKGGLVGDSPTLSKLEKHRSFWQVAQRIIAYRDRGVKMVLKLANFF
jgi:hypothetical protein